MQIKFLLLLCFNTACIFFTVRLHSQSTEGVVIDVYPIRVNHKSGFVRFFEGRILEITHPRYDYIGDEFLPWNDVNTTERSSLKLFELNTRVGVLDASLKEIIPNDYKSIRPMNPNFFAVERDSLYQLMDTGENIFFDGDRYEDIWWVAVCDQEKNGYFFIKKNGLWGLRRNNSPELIAPQYAAIEKASKSGFYKVKKDKSEKKWWLIDSTNQKVLNKPYHEIIMMSENLVAVFTDDKLWRLYSREKKAGYPIEESELGIQQFEVIEKLNERLFVAIPLLSRSSAARNKKIQLWNITLQDTIRSSFLKSQREANGFNDRLNRPNFEFNPRYEPLDDAYVKFVNTSRSGVDKYSMIDTLGKNPADTSFYAILSSNIQGTYIVVLERNAQFFSPGSGYSLGDENFGRIMPFEGRLALARAEDYYTVLGHCDSGQVVQLGSFFPEDSINILDDGYVQVKFEGNIINYQLNTDSCRFEEKEIVSNGILIDGDVSAITREAVGIRREKLNKDFSTAPAGNYLGIYRGGDTFALLKRKLPDAESDQPISVGVLPLDFLKHFPISILPNFILAYHEKEAVTHSLFTKQNFNGAVNLIRLYHMERKEYLPKIDMIGLRDFDHRCRLTSYLRPDGTMGLLDRNGQPVIKEGKEVSYAYIGPFVAGRARVALNGFLVFNKNQKWDLPGDFSVGSRRSFLKEFNIKSGAKLSKYTDYGMFVVDEKAVRWGYIDESGNFLFEVEAEHVKDYLEDSVAIILKQNGKKVWNRSDFGLINYEGKKVIDPIFSKLAIYKPYVKVSVDSTPTIYFTKKGHQIFMNRTRMRPFSEGLSQFKNQKGLWGYVDTLGNVVVEPQFKIARPFSEGLAMVVDSTDLCSFIDKKGEIVFTTHLTGRQWRALGDFRQGRCWFKEKKGRRWGCYDRKGEVAIAPAFYTVPNKNSRIDSFCLQRMDFKGGVAPVVVNGLEQDRKVGIIDTTGAYILEPCEDIFEINPFNAYGMASFRREQEGLLGLIHKTGKVIKEPAYLALEAFRNGFARVKGRNNLWGMIDSRGQEVLAPARKEIGVYSNGLIPVRNDGQEGWFFVDTADQVKLPGPYFKVGPFENGITMVSSRSGENVVIDTSGDTLSIGRGIPQFLSNGLIGMKDTTLKTTRYFYADANGRNVFARYFREISPYQKGIASVKKISDFGWENEKLGAINIRGVMVVPPKFGHIHIQADGNAIINPQRFHGLMSYDGQELLPPIFDNITEFKELNLFRVEQGERIGYVRIKDGQANWVWDLQY